MKKLAHSVIALVVLLSFSMAANAGFVTGVMVGAVVGSAVSSSNSSSSPAASPVIFSPNHDVISCVKGLYEVGTCSSYSFVSNNNGGTKRVYDKPAVYAAKAGYKYLHKVGVVIHDSTEYIIMEVSK